ncbi:3-deoxy-7-phosphoheptulonate synthase [Sphingomicrobium astaxanthinifaciens]|uniref:3-deoxy-7-phosphoheptulonate synthase n=1 Tax=Sphingomicrobium astaxanthinifaciens TaxID=1227949 RepID=UPI001FCA6CE5|nr:3-deoxy-7-phosphoheptulonate synthase [Sphingomicrobium astaxanthinifaciens]MCJ7421032.1 3-deoxy-7-phosphoheptulonate synthase [Sphingomicrobium astaxanthinifaciens]
MNRPITHPLTGWRPDRWRDFPAEQLPTYGDADALAAVERRLAAAAPVVPIAEIGALEQRLAAVAAGRAFLLQGGDCAENFDDAIAQRVARLARLFDAMAAPIEARTGRAVVRVARLAGQFAKPRSASSEQRGRIELPAYRGDIINGQGFSGPERAPDPERMIQAHIQSVGTAATLAAARHGCAPIYTSHEALLLPYEEALARRDADGRWWATSGHFLWLGDRTRQLEGAHVAFLEGVANPIGVKCGPGLAPDALAALVDRLDPAERPGRLTLIVRLGADRVEAQLPALFAAARGRAVSWIVDPMHGNTEKVEGRKLRRYDRILHEVRSFFRLARAGGVVPGGIHLEMSPDAVTECLGGGGPAAVADLDRAYRTACDPRLNGDQALRLITDLEQTL